MNIFVDRHHESLIESLYILFEKRLGHQVFVPIGMEWFERGYWKLNDQIDTARQFLEEGYKPADGTPPLNDDIQGTIIPRDTYNQRGITLDAFMKTKIDIIICSVPSHIQPYKELAAIKKAKLIVQIGNEWPVELFRGMNVLASIAPRDIPETNALFYHQEFDTSIFYPNFDKRQKKIYTFVNVLKEKPRDYELFLELEKLLPDWEFKMFGGQNRDGNLNKKELADAMRSCAFAFHCKTGGDGYGHVLYNNAFCATPVITRKSDYVGKLGQQLLMERTAIFVDDKSSAEVAADIIERYDSAQKMGKDISVLASVFVDFEHEANQVRNWMQNLL